MQGAIMRHLSIANRRAKARNARRRVLIGIADRWAKARNARRHVII